MGRVFRGFDEVRQAPVAVKQLMIGSLAGQAAEIERFRREGEALALLNHPGIVKVLDMFQEGGRHYIVMELVEGGTLEAALRVAKQLPMDRVIALALDLADALSRAHHLGIVHRDLKPGNVLLASDGSARLSDFGVAFMTGKERLSASSTLVGTLDYLSPETIRGETVDARSDIWALGVVVFELLAGSLPFTGEHAGAILHAILHASTPDLEALRPACPTELIDLVYRMLEKQRDQRIPSAREVGAELERIQRHLRPGASGEGKPRAVRKGALSVPDLEPSERFGETAFAATAAAVPADLPAQTTPFLGRERELAELARLFAEPAVRLVTILGPGGMGKSRLAIEAAQRLAQGSEEFAATLGTPRSQTAVVFVELAPLASSEFVLPAIAEAFSFKFYPGGDQKSQLLDYLRQRRALLVLDNFEHLLGAGMLVSEILLAAPGMRALVTSRERLLQSGEHVLLLAGLAYPDAEGVAALDDYSGVKLFLEGARRVSPDFALSEDCGRAVARICRQVQGLPLGIVLAASWANVLSAREIAHEIEGNFEFLSAELHDVPVRQHSLRAVFEYSYARLSDEERAAFVRLAVFRGGFTRAAAEGVAGASVKTLAALINKSLITRAPKGGRYHLHELLRQYAETRREYSPSDRERTADRHADYYVAFLHELGPRLRGNSAELAVAAIERELDNARAAWVRVLERDDLGRIRAALETFALFYALRSAFEEAEAAFAAAVTRLTAQSPERGSESGRLLARALALKAQAVGNLWRNVEAISVAAEALALFDEEHEPLFFGHALLVWAVASLWEGHVEGNLAAERAISLHRRAGDAWETARALLRYGRCQEWIGRSKAEASIREALELQRGLPGGPIVSGAGLHDLGCVIAERGHFAEGCLLMRQGLALLESRGSLFEQHLCLMSLATAERQCGDYEAAEQLARRSLALSREAFPFAETWALVVLGDVLKELGRFDEATHCYRACLVGGEALPRAVACVNLGDIALERGQPGAEALLAEGLAEFVRRRTRWGTVIAYQYLGHLACSEGRVEIAGRYFQRGLVDALAGDLLPLAISTLAGIARTKVLEGDLERAVELLCLVEHHPACERGTLDRRVKPLLAELPSRLANVSFTAAAMRGRALDPDATLRELHFVDSFVDSRDCRRP